MELEKAKAPINNGVRTEGTAVLAGIDEATPDLQEQIIPNTNPFYLFTKRCFDILVSALALIILSPVMLLTAVAIKIEDPKGKVFYKQERIGQNGEAFWCHKYRSMCSSADDIKASLMSQNEMDGPVFKIRDDPRITRVGHFIRKMSIDELPQFYDVLRGRMSLVGPRPLPVEEELACDAYQRQRERVKPGITCYWQVEGRNEVSFKEWIEWDLKYIREQSLLTDLRILIRTIPAVLSMRGGVLGQYRRAGHRSLSPSQTNGRSIDFASARLIF